ncbi:universal stress protein [Rhodoferax sp.]|uniref:universal stress protein n=1 Tax=Rhodoferax sp. TaxID=50421 RepID=UPI00374DF771
MSYATLMVHLELGRSNAELLQVTLNLAQRFRSGVVGIAACQPMQLVYGDGYVYGELIEENRLEIAKEMAQAEAEFRSVLQSQAPWVEWRSTTGYVSLSDYLASEARSADLFITSVAKSELFDPSRTVDTGDLIMQIGRPVLVVPPSAEQAQLNRVVIGWKDTRETRRAVYDALPLLKHATDVRVVELAAQSDLADARARLADVVAWLHRHGVVAESLAPLATGDDAAQLSAIAWEYEADLVVAGAYGHSRLREWALGGVTRSLLLQTGRCALVSH